MHCMEAIHCFQLVHHSGVAVAGVGNKQLSKREVWQFSCEWYPGMAQMLNSGHLLDG